MAGCQAKNCSKSLPEIFVGDFIGESGSFILLESVGGSGGGGVGVVVSLGGRRASELDVVVVNDLGGAGVRLVVAENVGLYEREGGQKRK